MILVLCEETDLSAQWAARAFRRRGCPVTLLTGADLAGAIKWKHTIGQAGADCEIRLANGACLRGGDTRGVLNRLSSVPAFWLRRYGGADRDYATQEMHAFYLSWLHALPGPVLNPPTPQGLCGNWRHASAWTWLAVQAGLPACPFRRSSSDDLDAADKVAPAAAQLYVVDRRVVGPSFLVGPYEEACVRLAKSAGAPMIGINFAPEASGVWQMTGASILPDLIDGGQPLADAMTEALTDVNGGVAR